MFRQFVRLNSTTTSASAAAAAVPKTKSSLLFPSLASLNPETDLVGSKLIGGKSKTYFVKRTTEGNLPVYKTIKRQAIFTDVRRVEGDIIQLRNDIQALFPQIEKNQYSCLMDSKTIRIKGDLTKELKKLLAVKF